MRHWLLVAALLASAPATLHAQTITTFEAAPGQAALQMQPFQPPQAGTSPMNLAVGIGSAAFRDPNGPDNTFYTVSDRGPNYTCDDAEGLMTVKAKDACPEVGGMKAGDGRLYPTPDFNVSLYKVTIDPETKTFTVAQVIGLKTPKGTPITGLTNPLKVAKTDKPRDGAGNPIPADINSIDAEGIVRLPDGRFFIGEENATGIVEVSPEGVITRRFVPAGTEADFAAAEYPVVGSLPAVLAKRTSNRGIESLSMSDDAHYLYALVQNPLSNPDSKAYGDAVNTRLLKIEIGGSAGAATLTPVAEYIYQLDDWKTYAALGATDAKKASSLRISEMTSLGGERFLVDERTDQLAKVFGISLAGATNILGTKWDDAATAPSLEQTDLASASITPVSKTEVLVASSVEGANPRYPAKLEGMAMTRDGKLMMINDSDFGISGETTRIVMVDGLEVALKKIASQ